MAKLTKISLSEARDIPFDKLVLSSRNVRRVQASVSIETLAEDIARRTLLQSLSVRPVPGKNGEPTDKYEIQAGGRRYRALALLVKQKRLAKPRPSPVSSARTALRRRTRWRRIASASRSTRSTSSEPSSCLEVRA